jgi:hypothetical protein
VQGPQRSTASEEEKARGSSKVALWSMVRQQPRWPPRRLQRLSDQRRLVVVVIKKGPNHLYGAAETVVGLGTTLAHAEKIQRYLLNQMLARHT